MTNSDVGCAAEIGIRTFERVLYRPSSCKASDTIGRLNITFRFRFHRDLYKSVSMIAVFVSMSRVRSQYVDIQCVAVQVSVSTQRRMFTENGSSLIEHTRQRISFWNARHGCGAEPPCCRYRDLFPGCLRRHQVPASKMPEKPPLSALQSRDRKRGRSWSP